MPAIKQNEMDEAVLMVRVLSLLRYMDMLFEDHGKKPLSERATEIKKFIDTQFKLGNPYDDRENMDKCYTHVFKLVECLGEEIMESSALEDIAYEITEGHFSGEVSSTLTTFVNRQVMDELLMTQGSDAGFLNKGGDDEDEA